MNITENEIETLKNCKSEEEWEVACDAIQAARNGDYPPDWWAKVQMTGLAHRVQQSW